MTTSHYHRHECRAFVLYGDFIISQFKISYCDKFALYLQSSYYALMSSSSLSTLSKPADLITLGKLGSSTAKVSWAETSSLFPWRLAVAVSVWYVCVCACCQFYLHCCYNKLSAVWDSYTAFRLFTSFTQLSLPTLSSLLSSQADISERARALLPLSQCHLFTAVWRLSFTTPGIRVPERYLASLQLNFYLKFYFFFCCFSCFPCIFEIQLCFCLLLVMLMLSPD